MKHMLWLLLLTSSCALPHPLQIGYHGSPEGYDQAQEAVYAWNSSCGHTVAELHWGDDEINMEETSGMPEGFFGATYINKWGPYRIRFMRGWQAPVTIAHEIGHARGLDHREGGIMTPGVYEPFLNPATRYKTILPGVIRPEDCNDI